MLSKEELIRLAKQHYIFDASLTKIEIIRTIQHAEGNFDCYGTAVSGDCDQSGCRWREDCVTESW